TQPPRPVALQPSPAPLPASQPPRRRAPANGKPRKQDLLIALAAQRHDLPSLPLARASAIATAISAEIGLHPGTPRPARRALRPHLQPRHHHPSPPPPAALAPPPSMRPGRHKPKPRSPLTPRSASWRPPSALAGSPA